VGSIVTIFDGGKEKTGKVVSVNNDGSLKIDFTEVKDIPFQQKLEFQAGLSEVLPKLAYESDNEKRLALSGFESKFFDTYEITLEDGEKQVIEKATGEVLRDKLLHYRTPGDVRVCTIYA